jgi:hypothetical protein
MRAGSTRVQSPPGGAVVGLGARILSHLQYERGPLPQPATPLIGRGAELVAARNALTAETVRLLTFTGTAGVGKTRLAHEIGQQLASTFADGVRWVDLAPLAEAHLVLPTIARRLGLTEGGHVPVMDQI